MHGAHHAEGAAMHREHEADAAEEAVVVREALLGGGAWGLELGLGFGVKVRIGLRLGLGLGLKLGNDLLLPTCVAVSRVMTTWLGVGVRYRVIELG